ncbi:hypothetical protein G5C51_00975 [Streptomyces sp. A7024]|uniref:Uncharacterized protein n=1 Tax=Streptomyces coryli TaxID=1128680 RepID=A0A6G4TR67_9ACTN|nr:hypothetical protein [Streptomyces coryli]NGN62485.1 hypothetical protein [Streptomyces coryli]
MMLLAVLAPLAMLGVLLALAAWEDWLLPTRNPSADEATGWHPETR